MRTVFLAAMAVTVLGATPALAQGESTQAGSEAVESGASLAAEGSGALSEGNVVGGSVAVPLGAGSMAAGSAGVGVGVLTDAMSAPVEAAFGSEPLPLTDATVVAQPAPNVPYAPDAEHAKPEADRQP